MISYYQVSSSLHSDSRAHRFPPSSDGNLIPISTVEPHERAHRDIPREAVEAFALGATVEAKAQIARVGVEDAFDDRAIGGDGAASAAYDLSTLIQQLDLSAMSVGVVLGWWRSRHHKIARKTLAEDLALEVGQIEEVGL